MQLHFGCVFLLTIKFLFGLNYLYALKVTVSDVFGLHFIGCCLCLFKNDTSVFLLCVSVSLFLSHYLVCQHGV